MQTVQHDDQATAMCIDFSENYVAMQTICAVNPVCLQRLMMLVARVTGRIMIISTPEVGMLLYIPSSNTTQRVQLPNGFKNRALNAFGTRVLEYWVRGHPRGIKGDLV